MQQVIHMRQGKGGRERLVPMPLKLYKLLRAYYRHERPPLPWLFTTRRVVARSATRRRVEPSRLLGHPPWLA